MPNNDGDRSRHFPAIETKHGKPVSHWFAGLKKLGSTKYDVQMSFLMDTHGFSRAHANALVMHHRGSTTSRRFATPDDYFASIDPVAARTARAIFALVQKKHPDLDFVVAWNQPMLRSGSKVVLGVSASKNHLTIGPIDSAILERFAARLEDVRVNKKTIVVPFDWKIDRVLLLGLAGSRLSG